MHHPLHGKSSMTLRIEKISEGGKTTIRVSGRVGLEHLVELEAELDGMVLGTVLDLEHVTLVDVEGVRFLSACENKKPCASSSTAAVRKTGTAVKRSKMKPPAATPAVCPI